MAQFSNYTAIDAPADADIFLVYDDSAGATRKVTLQQLGDYIDTDQGFVTGPGSSTDNAVARFDSTTGKIVQNSGVIIDDSNNVTGVASLTTTDLTASGAVILKGSTMSTFVASLIDDADALTARATLGLVIGTNVQAYDADLTAIAALSSADGNFIVGSATGWVAESGATARTSLGLGNVENTALSTWAGSANITTIGTIATGVWNGTVIDSAYIDQSLSVASITTSGAATVGTTLGVTGAATFSGVVGIGVAAQTALDVGVGNSAWMGASEASIFSTGVMTALANNDANTPPWFSYRKARGSFASRSALVSSDLIGVLAAEGYDGSAFQYASDIRFLVGGSVSSGVVPGSIYFTTVGTSGGGRVERMAVLADGMVGINMTTPVADTKLYVKGGTTIGNDNSVSSVVPLTLKGLAILNVDTNVYGDYGGLLLSASASVTSAARRYLVTNAYDGNKFAIVRSVDATTNPSLGTAGVISSGTADFVIDNTGLVSLGSLTATGTLTASGTVVLKGSTMSTYGASLIDDADASAARTTLGLVIDTDVQAYSATLAAVAAGTYTGASSITTVGTLASGAINWTGSITTTGTLASGNATVTGTLTASSYLQGTTTNGYLDLRGDSGATSGVRILDTGNVGIGATSAGYALNVQKTADTTGMNVITGISDGFYNGYAVGSYYAVGWSGGSTLDLGGYRATQWTEVRIHASATPVASFTSTGATVTGTATVNASTAGILTLTRASAFVTITGSGDSSDPQFIYDYNSSITWAAGVDASADAFVVADGASVNTGSQRLIVGSTGTTVAGTLGVTGVFTNTSTGTSYFSQPTAFVLGATSTASNAQFYATKTYSSASGNDIGVNTFYTQSVATTGGLRGLYNYAGATHTSGAVATINSVSANALATGAGGTVTNAYALRANVLNTNATAVITNAYGLYVDPFTATGTITNRWGIYQAGASEKNYFAGTTLIGTTSAAGNEILRVNGLIHSDSDSIIIDTAKTPASAGATGTQGQIAWDSDYIYVCTATNTWKRAAIATWP